MSVNGRAKSKRQIEAEANETEAKRLFATVAAGVYAIMGKLGVTDDEYAEAVKAVTGRAPQASEPGGG